MPFFFKRFFRVTSIRILRNPQRKSTLRSVLSFCVLSLSLFSRGCLAKLEGKRPSTAWPDVYTDVLFLWQGCKQWEQGECRPHSQHHGGHAAPQTEVPLLFPWFVIMDMALLVYRESDDGLMCLLVFYRCEDMVDVRRLKMLQMVQLFKCEEDASQVRAWNSNGETFRSGSVVSAGL